MTRRQALMTAGAAELCLGAATVTYSNAGSDNPLRVTETYTTDGEVLDWTIQLTAADHAPVRIGHLSVSIPTVGPGGGSPSRIIEHGFDFFYGYINMWHGHNFYPSWIVRNGERIPRRNVPQPRWKDSPQGNGVAETMNNAYTPQTP